MRVAVLGAGAMGCLFGGRLRESGQDVVLIRVDERQIDAINSTGLRLETDDGDRRITVPAARAASVDGRRAKAALAHAFAEHRNHAPSMLQDVLAGRPTEIESINGAIVAAAASAHVAVPVTETLLRLVRLIELPSRI